MLDKKIFTTTYFGPIDYYAHIIQSANGIIIEKDDNFQKQTYRNRTYIYGANGKLMLNVPVSHITDNNNRKKTKDSIIANEFKWQKLHWKSIESAYRTSPYFEYYEDDIKPIFERKYENLFELNNDIMDFISETLQTPIEREFTEEYFAEPENIVDLRNNFSTKKTTQIELPEYTQVFSNKLGYIPNLSILDLIFNEGPNALNYLENVSL
ncbi:MAG: WbqC family protein [Ichthyobacteriaceae bacterium]|nr:WbqC family protein [Ichthyobacteriaceae bacterium]